MLRLFMRISASLPYGLIGGIIGGLAGFANVVIGSGVGHWLGAIILVGYSNGVGLTKVTWYTARIRNLLDATNTLLQEGGSNVSSVAQIAAISFVIVIAFSTLARLLPAVQGGVVRQTALMPAIFSPWLFSPAVVIGAITALLTMTYGNIGHQYNELVFGWPIINMPVAFGQLFDMHLVYPLVCMYPFRASPIARS